MTYKKLIFVLPVLFVAAVLFSGCEKTSDMTPISESVTDIILPLEGEGAYVIIRPEAASKEETVLATELRKMIAEKTGISIQIKDDYVREGTSFTMSDTEICFGATNREESIRANEGLKLNDYRIRLDGTKLVIAYGSVEAGREAIERFAEEYITQDSIAIPADLDVAELRKYQLDTITIDGHDISEYVIVGEDGFTSTVRDAIAGITGITLKTSASVSAKKPNIMLETLPDLSADEAGVRLADGNVVAGTSGAEYYNEAAIPLLLRTLTKNSGTLTGKDLNIKEKIVVEYKLPFKRGVNLKGLDSYPYTDSLDLALSSYTYYFSLPETFTEIREKGFDHVCLYVSLLDYYDEASDTVVTSGAYDIANLDGVIRRAMDAGLYVMLRCCQRGWEFSANNPAHCAQFVKMWSCIAEHYKDWDEKLVFNFQAEVDGTDNSAENFNKLQLEVLEAVRKTNPDRWVVLTVQDYCQIWRLDTFVQPKKDTHYAVSVHLYSPIAFTHQGATWDDPTNNYQVRLAYEHISALNRDLAHLREYMRKHPDIPIILGEFGVHQGVADHDDTIEWLTLVRTFCEKYGITWTYWVYADQPASRRIRAMYEARGIDYDEEQIEKMFGGFSVRLDFDTDWRHYILKGLGLE